MTDSKITPVTSSSVSAPSAGSTATPVTQRTRGLAEALLTAAPVKDAPPEYRNAVDGLRVEGRVVSSNPQTGESMQIAAKTVPRFSAGAELKKAVE